MFPEKHQGTLRESMGCGVQLSAQPSIYIYIYAQTGTFIYPEPPNTMKIAKTMKIMW